MSRFNVVLRGYDRAQVDAVIDRIDATMAAGTARNLLPGPDRPQSINAEEVARSRFDVVLRGYDRAQVDDALREHIRCLRASAPRPTRPRRPQARPGWLIGWIEQARFTGVRIRGGYDVREVDAFLRRVIAGLRGTAPPVDADDVHGSLFRRVRFRPGYVEREVDVFLNQLAAALGGE